MRPGIANAIAELQKAAAVSGDRPAVKAALAQTYAAAGKRAEARKLLNELEELSKQRYFSPYLMAAIYAELGQRDRAFALLEKAWVEHAIPMIQIKLDPIFDSLHSDPRFKELLHRLGIAD